MGLGGGITSRSIPTAQTALRHPLDSYAWSSIPPPARPIADIPGQLQNHGVAIAADVGRGFISDGKDASVTIFDLKTNEILGKVHADDDADGITYDPASHKILVVCGDAGVMIPIAADVDPKTGKADPAVELGGKPEFLRRRWAWQSFISTLKTRMKSLWWTPKR